MTENSGEYIGKPKPRAAKRPAVDSETTKAIGKTQPKQIPTALPVNARRSGQPPRSKSKLGSPNEQDQNNSAAPIAISKIKYSKVAGSRSAGAKSKDAETKATSELMPPVLPDKKFVANKSPNPNYIPKQQQITPELEAQLRERAKQQEQVMMIRNWFERMAIALLLLSIPVGIAAYYRYAADIPWLSDKELPAKVEAPEIAASTTPLETVLKNGSVHELKNFSSLRGEDLATGGLLTQLQASQDRLKISERIMELEPNSESSLFAIKLKFNSLISLASLDMHNQLKLHVIQTELTRFSEQNLKSDIPIVVTFAQMGQLFASVQQFLNDESDPNFEKLKIALSTPFAEFTSDTQQHLLIANGLIGLSKQTNKADELQRTLAMNLKASTQPLQHSLGAHLYDQCATGIIDYAILRHMLYLRNNNAIDQLEQILNDIEKSPDVSFSVYLDTLASIGCLDQQKFVGDDEVTPAEQEKTRAFYANLSQSSAAIIDPIVAEKVKQIFQQYDTRSKLIGKSFEFVGESPNLQKVDPQATATAIVFIESAANTTLDRLSALENYAIANTEIQFVIVFTDDLPLATDKVKKIESAMPSGILIEPQFKQTFLEQCPISWTPYIMLLDHKNKVRQIDVDPSNFRKAVANVAYPD